MKKRIFFLACMLFLVTVAAIGQNAKKYIKAGNEFIENMKYEDAIGQFTSAIGIEPSNSDYYYIRGQANEKLLKFAEARSDYEKALVFSPRMVEAMIRLAAVCNSTGNFEEALKLLNRASGMEKRNTKVYPEKVISLIGLKMYDQALRVSDTAIIIKDTPMDFYYRGVIYRKLNNDILAKKELEKAISKDKKLAEPRLALAELLMSTNIKEAMYQCNEVLKVNDRNTAAYITRSKVYMKSLDPSSAINDLSKCILIDPANVDFYFERGNIYQELKQHANAINDYSKYISLNDKEPKAYYSRATSYEENMNYEKAKEDYAKITVLAKYDVLAKELLDGANTRIYELNREKEAPVIALTTPVPSGSSVEVRGDKNAILVSGTIKDKSRIKSFMINNKDVPIVEKGAENEFLFNVDVRDLENITFTARDDYNNEKVLNYSIIRTEITPPLIKIMAPYTSESMQVYLETTTPNISIQGKIEDQSKIKSITVGDKMASYNPNELNPSFTATLDVSNINKFTVVVEDVYGNLQNTEYILNREGAGITSTNPMGKTWVIFIENSSYETFGALDGPIKDISTIERSLANYQIHRVIHKKDMRKSEMEKYFNIELRDLVRGNQVKSLLIWYAGHGKYINDVGYWIPVDAKRDEEYTYFNINFLKAGLMGYENDIVHTLIISDACESGPGFYTAMRAGYEEPACDNSFAAGSKSAQVFSSTGDYQLATDNSRFAASFASILNSNKNACIPIQKIVKEVTSAVDNGKGQKPKFGTIQGLTDLDGTFFFIAK